MFVLEALLSLLTQSETNVFHSSKIATNTTICPTKVVIRHELCYTEECLHPVFLNATTFEIPIEICVDMLMLSRVCTTENCLSTASQFIESIDESVNPCDDFHGFTCGSFIKNTRIDPEIEYIGYFTTRNEEVISELRLLVNEPIEYYEEPSTLLAKTLFKACMNLTAIADTDLMPVFDILKRFGGWPIQDLHNWDGTKFNVQEFVERCLSEGYSLNYFYSISTMNWPSRDSTRYIFLSLPELEIDYMYLYSGTWTVQAQKVLSYMQQIVHELKIVNKIITTELNQVLHFEVELAKIMKSSNRLPSIMTVHEIETQLTQYALNSNQPISTKWLSHLNNLVSGQRQIYSDTKILVQIDFLRQLLSLVATTPKRTLANYALWRVVRDSIPFLTFDPHDTKIRHVQCERTVSTQLPYATAAMFVYRHNIPKLNSHITRLFNDIRYQVKINVNKLTWADKKDIDEILERLKKLTLYIGFPSHLVSSNAINKYYNNLYISANDFLGSVRNITIHKNKFLLKLPWQDFNESACGSYVYTDALQLIETMGSYTYCEDNAINLRLPIVTGNFFSEYRPDYLNYGSLGSIIGHELSHLVERNIVKNLVSTRTAQGYEQEVKCLNNQFSHYSIQGRYVNVHQTERENVADLFGLKVAHDAFVNHTKKNQNREPILPGLQKYTSKQLFWISSAYKLCAVYSQKGIDALMTEDEHAPSKFRINTSVKNMKEFGKDFNCPLGKNMNPVMKCSPIYAPP